MPSSLVLMHSQLDALLLVQLLFLLLPLLLLLLLPQLPLLLLLLLLLLSLLLHLLLPLLLLHQDASRRLTVSAAESLLTLYARTVCNPTTRDVASTVCNPKPVTECNTIA